MVPNDGDWLVKKIAVLSLLVFALAFVVGTNFAPTTATAGFSFCWFQCGCNGVPDYCCYSNGQVSCKPAPWAPISCPQEADC